MLEKRLIKIIGLALNGGYQTLFATRMNTLERKSATP